MPDVKLHCIWAATLRHKDDLHSLDASLYTPWAKENESVEVRAIISPPLEGEFQFKHIDESSLPSPKDFGFDSSPNQEFGGES